MDERGVYSPNRQSDDSLVGRGDGLQAGGHRIKPRGGKSFFRVYVDAQSVPKVVQSWVDGKGRLETEKSGKKEAERGETRSLRRVQKWWKKRCTLAGIRTQCRNRQPFLLIDKLLATSQEL